MATKSPVFDPRNSVNVVNTSGMTRVRHARPHMLARMERRAKINARSFVREMKRIAAAAPAACEIHPTYTGERAPRSKAKGCTCRAVYEARKAATS